MTELANNETNEAWSQFQADMKSLGADLRRHYESSTDTEKSAEINRSLKQLGEAADAFFSSLDTASKDPEVRAGTRRAAHSFGSALRETLHEVGEELDKAFRQSAEKK